VWWLGTGSKDKSCEVPLISQHQTVRHKNHSTVTYKQYLFSISSCLNLRISWVSQIISNYFRSVLIFVPGALVILSEDQTRRGQYTAKQDPIGKGLPPHNDLRKNLSWSFGPISVPLLNNFPSEAV
jgi:hypothetical protein